MHILQNYSQSLNSIESEFLKKKIQFASDFKLYDNQEWQRQLLKSKHSKKQITKDAHSPEGQSHRQTPTPTQPQFESMVIIEEEPAQMMQNKISQQQPALH